jgi:hypothetical protein
MEEGYMNMRWQLNSCRAHRENVSLLACGALPENERTSVRDHLADCAKCRQAFEKIVRLSGDFRQWTSTVQPIGAGAAFRARWMQSVQSANGSARTWSATLISHWSECLWPSPLAWGTLAAIWICLLSFRWVTTPQRAPGYEMAGSRSTTTKITFAQRQRELTFLLETFDRPRGPAASKPGISRPRTQRRVGSVAT